jgi:hypothetical protein
MKLQINFNMRGVSAGRMGQQGRLMDAVKDAGR